MANWIELATSQTDWRGLKITSHCYHIRGTSYLYRTGLDIPNLQRSARWAHTDTSSVEHYLKPGLYSASPETIRNTLPQYKATISISRALYLRDRITTPGGMEHLFNAVLKHWGLPNLQRPIYPTNKVHGTYMAKQAAALASKFLQKVKDKRNRLQELHIKRAHRAANFKMQKRQWKQQTASLPPKYGSLTDVSIHKQCVSCKSMQRGAISSTAKIQSPSYEITRQKELSTQLQETKLKLCTMNSANSAMKWKILQQERWIKQQTADIQNLKEIIANISQEMIN